MAQVDAAVLSSLPTLANHELGRITDPPLIRPLRAELSVFDNALSQPTAAAPKLELAES